MKILLFLFVFGVAAASDAPPFQAASGQWKGHVYELWLDGIVPGNWDPEKSEPPLSVSKGVVLARKALVQIVGEESFSMFCYSITISPNSGHYIVTFATTPTTAAFAGKKSFDPTVLPFAVFSDGTVRSPKKGPIQSSQPTPQKRRG